MLHRPHEVLHMSSANPRLSVVLTPSLASTLAAISAETGDSASSLVRNLLEQTHPALLRMLELIRAAKSAQGQIGQGLASSLDRVVDDLQDAVAVADARTGRAIADLVEQAQAVKGRRRPSRMDAQRPPARPAALPSTPRPVTRGVGHAKRGKSGVSGG